MGWEVINATCFGKDSGAQASFASPGKVKVLGQSHQPPVVNTGVSVWPPLTHSLKMHFASKISSKNWKTFEVSLIDLSPLVN